MIAENISSEISVGEFFKLYPGAQRALFRLYHLGGCSSCGIRPDESLAQLCMRSGGLDPEEVIQKVGEALVEDERMSIQPVELSEALKEKTPDNRNTVRILDIRTREEFEAVHMKGSVLFTQELMKEIMSEWPREELLVILDHRGLRSLDAAAYFAGHGFTNVRSLKGGIDAWSEQIDPSLSRYIVE